MNQVNSKTDRVFKIISLIVFILLLSYIFWLELDQRIAVKKIEILKDEVTELQKTTASSTADFNDLYETLTRVINEEGLKNKTLQEKVSSLDKFVKADPVLLQKYSKVFFLNENYRPLETQVILPEYTAYPKNEYRVHVNVVYFLLSMIDNAKKDDMDLLVVSAYRSFQTQTSLKAQNKLTYGANTANRFVAEQGYSEHQLGTTVDLTTSNIRAANMNFEKTKEYTWLQNNAHKYGFIISYPKGNQYYAYEPWHWRFVGKVLATQLYNDKINFYNLDQRFIDGYLVNMFDR
jgi:D-alanyl-D-alanine carboxypeptidase